MPSRFPGLLDLPVLYNVYIYNNNTYAISTTGQSNFVGDSTKALDWALSGSAGGAAHLAGNTTFTVTGSISLRNKTMLFGEGRGTIIKLDNNVTNIGVVNNFAQNFSEEGMIIKDLTIDGNRANNTTGSYGLAFIRTTSCLIENIYVTGSRGNGISFTDCDNSIIRDCIVTDAGLWGIRILAETTNKSDHNRITGNLILNNDKLGIGSGGILIEGNPASVSCFDNMIINNRITASGSGNSHDFGIQTFGGANNTMIIANNLRVGNLTPISLVGSNNVTGSNLT